MASLLIEFTNQTDLQEQMRAIGFVPLSEVGAYVVPATPEDKVPVTVAGEVKVVADAPKPAPAPIEKKPRRKRRTKAEMEAARAGNGQDKAAPEPKPEPVRPAPTPKDEAVLPSLDDIRALVQKLAPTHLQECADVLAEFGVTKSSDLDPQHYDAVHTKLSALQS